MGRIFNPPRKVDLQTLFNNGDITVTNSPEDALSGGAAALFDGVNPGASDPFRLRIDQDSGTEFVQLDFSNTLPKGLRFRLKISTYITETGTVFVNDREIGTINVDGLDYPGITQIDFNANSIRKIRLELLTSGSNQDHRITEIELFILEDSESSNFEFNDSVLTTKAWNSSRYSGKQLSATKINRFTAGDSTYGKTPVIQNYSRNIYIGNDIVSIDSETREDPNLLPIDDFSYLQTNRFITVNEDDTITDTRLEQIGDDINPKVGFYQSFFDDFPEQSGCRIVLFDNIAKNNLKPNYTVYYNGGQLNQIFRYRPGLSGFTNPYKIFYTAEDGGIEGNNSVILTGSSEIVLNLLALNAQIHNEDLLRDFYADTLTNVGTSATNAASHDVVYNDLFNYKNNSNYKNNKRFFISFMRSGSGDSTVLRTTATGSIPIGTSTALRTNNLAELSTGEIRSSSINDGQHNLEIFFTNKSTLSQDYIASDNLAFSKPENAHLGDVVLSQNIDDTPSLLVNLNKSSELVGSSNNVYAIIPENLHPYIKDNLLYFLTQAGINVGGDTSTILKINPSNRLLK